MQISVIIPTLNEEGYLPKLLECIKHQTIKDYEVIISDAGSKDKTKEIAKKYGAKVVKGGMPAVGRNNGAKVAKGDFLFFFDADIKFSKDFFRISIDELDRRFLDLATCEAKPLSNLRLDKMFFKIADMVIKTAQFSRPLSGGYCIMVTKRLFERIGGFDESITMAEDHDFVQRAAEFRPLRVLNDVSITMNIRRLKKEGRFGLAGKYIQSGLYMFFKGKIRSEIIEYDFGDFNNEKKLNALEKKLIKFDHDLNRLLKINGKKKSRISRFKKRFKDEIKKL